MSARDSSAEAAVQFVLGLQSRQGTQAEENNVRAALARPLLLDNIQPHLTLGQLNRRETDRTLANQRRQRLPRKLRRPAPVPIASPELEAELNEIWRTHQGDKATSEYMFTTELDLTGCPLVVVATLGKTHNITGTVIGETKRIIHLSNATTKRLYHIPKRGTVFSYDGVSFRRCCGE